MIRSTTVGAEVGVPTGVPGVPDEPSASVSAEATRALVGAIIAQVETSLRHVRCAASERLIRQGVSMIHLHVLWQLDEHGELTMSRIAELVGVSLSNATGLIDRMEERGLVERARLTDDRRVVHVRPTARGLEVARTIEVLRADLIEAVLARLDDDQLARAAQTVADLRAALFAGPHPLVIAATDCGPVVRSGDPGEIQPLTQPVPDVTGSDKENQHS